MRLRLVILLVIAASVVQVAFGQNKSKPQTSGGAPVSPTLPATKADNSPLSFALTVEEQKALVSAAQFRKSWQDSLEQAENTALTATLKCEDALAAVGNMQKAYAMREAANARLDALLNAHRLSHSCGECDYDPSGKSLVKKAETKP